MRIYIRRSDSELFLMLTAVTTTLNRNRMLPPRSQGYWTGLSAAGKGHLRKFETRALPRQERLSDKG